MTRAVVQAPHEGRRDRCVSRATGRGRHSAGTLADSANRAEGSLRHKPAGRMATTSRRPGAQAQNWPIRARHRHACASAQGRALAAFVAVIPRAAGGGAVPRAARRHHSGGRSAPLGSAGLRGQRALLPPPRSPWETPETERVLTCP